MLHFHDRVYGDVTINEPVIEDLIATAEVQRLQRIDQAGYFEPYHPGTSHSRFEHSLGVFLLLRNYGASLTEQIAGILHDVSHSAFSHAIDYALGSDTEKTQSYQDDYFVTYVMESHVPEVLKRHGYDVCDILDFAQFPLLETILPDLCADRIDYALRGMVLFRVTSLRDVRNMLDALVVRDGRWVFRDATHAMRYARFFAALNKNYYAGITTAVMFRRVGDYIQHALTHNYITHADLYTNDIAVITKVNAYLSDDAHLRLLWTRMNSGSGYRNDPQNYDAHVFCKSRIVDPLCEHHGSIVRVSDVYPAWRAVVQEEMHPKEYFLRFID